MSDTQVPINLTPMEWQRVRTHLIIRQSQTYLNRHQRVSDAIGEILEKIQGQLKGATNNA